MNSTGGTDYHAIFYNSSVACTILSFIAFVVNLYLIICSRYLRRPIGINLRLCVSLSASDALAAFCYILTYCINVIFPSDISNCWSLLLEVIKFTTFFASVSTLLILALNHYVGIVYPLRRDVITNRSIRIAIPLSYLVPFVVFFVLFCIVPGGFRAPIAFGFFSKDGCASRRFLQSSIVRSVIVGPFIIFVLLISFLYCHIIYHMSRTSKDPLIVNNTNKRKYNAKLLSTLALLAGSAVIGWLPTTVLFALICQECIFPIALPVLMYLTILSHFLNIFKLIFDGLIYASRLIEIRFAMWEFHNSLLSSIDDIFGTKKHRRNVPQEFLKYLNESNRSLKTRRMEGAVNFSAKKSLTSQTSNSRALLPMGRIDSLASPAELKRLGEHKYSAVDNSWLDELCMKKWWEYVVTWCPMWIAPNLITLIGLIINLVTVLVLGSYSYSATESAPGWAYIQAAFGLFLYQTLDAIDGKQARRTNSSSPLGELFDHGCDSMTQVFVTLNICYALSLGRIPNGVMIVSIISVVMYYCAHWSTYCTGQLRFSRFDVTEAQMTVISVLLTTAVFGNSFWSISLFYGLQIRHVIVISCTIVSIGQIYGYLKVIFSGGAGKNGSTIAGTSVLFPLAPLLLVIMPFVMIYKKSSSSVYDEHITLLMLCMGAVGAKATNRLVIAHMSKSELRLWDWIYMGPLMIMLNQYYDNPVDEYKLLIFVTIYCYTSLLIFCTVVCRQFCEHLNIYCFTLGPRQATKST